MGCLKDVFEQPIFFFISLYRKTEKKTYLKMGAKPPSRLV